MRPYERIKLSPEDLAFINGPLMQKKIWALISEREVELILPHTSVIGPDVEIGKGTRIWHGVTLLGKTRIGENCEIEPGVMLEDAEVGDRSTIHAGAYIRGECRVDQDVEVWAGVRIYNSWLKSRVVAHSCARIVRSIIRENADIDSHSLIKDTDVAEGSKVGAHAVITGKRRPHREFRRD